MIETGGEYGMMTFEHALEDLAKGGYIDKEDKDKNVSARAIYKEKERL
jgi:Tfp pilus assembly pilus retraction ATPase PilT